MAFFFQTDLPGQQNWDPNIFCCKLGKTVGWKGIEDAKRISCLGYLFFPCEIPEGKPICMPVIRRVILGMNLCPPGEVDLREKGISWNVSLYKGEIHPVGDGKGLGEYGPAPQNEDLLFAGTQGNALLQAVRDVAIRAEGDMPLAREDDIAVAGKEAIFSQVAVLAHEECLARCDFPKPLMIIRQAPWQLVVAADGAVARKGGNEANDRLHSLLLRPAR